MIEPKVSKFDPNATSKKTAKRKEPMTPSSASNKEKHSLGMPSPSGIYNQLKSSFTNMLSKSGAKKDSKEKVAEVPDDKDQSQVSS